MRRTCILATRVAATSIAATLVTAAALRAQSDPTALPLLQIEDLLYVGAFRLPADTFGDSSLNYSEGPLAYDAASNSVFIVGHNHHQQIAQFAVPVIEASTRLDELAMASVPVQVFAPILDRATGGNPQALDRIGGMIVVSGNAGAELLINAYEYYDAPTDNTQTSLVVRDPDDLAGSTVAGFFSFAGGAGHTSGWLSPIPPEWQALLGGSHLTGQSSGIPIISRTSVGPSAFAFDPLDLVGGGVVPTPVPTVTLLDFSLDEPLHEDLSNDSGDNELWTHLSRVIYGLVVPGTRSYLTVGHSGGHESGVCYKCVQSDGNLCGGYCARDAGDYARFFWLWDVADLVAVKAGLLQASQVRPYVYGPLEMPFTTIELGGGSFDPDSGLLYLSLQRADLEQGEYSNPPVVAVYAFQPSDVLFRDGFETGAIAEWSDTP